MELANVAVEKSIPLLFTKGEQTLGETLLHHQCWCWGRDVHYSAGNLLIRRGFMRHGVPDRETGSNAYLLQLNERSTIVLWGFGVLFGDFEQSGIFLPRYQFVPRLLSAARVKLPLWKKEQLPPTRQPRTAEEIFLTLTLTAGLLRFIVDYEMWIKNECGREWRRNCLRNWENTVLNQTEINRGWCKLLRVCQKRLAEV